MSSAVSALQNTINRFAVVGGFPRVAVDGAWGSATKQGIYSTLSWIGQGKCYQTACAIDEDAKTAGQLITQWDKSPNAAQGFSDFFGRVADDLGIPHVPAPVVTGGGSTPGPLPIAFKPSLMDRLRALTVWQQVLIGVAAGLGLILVANRIKKRSPKPRRA